MTDPETLYEPLTWADVLADPSLQNLPYKVELEDGKITMSPAGNKHGMVQTDVAAELRSRPGGKAWVEGSVQCGLNTTQVADVVWMSDARFAQHGAPDPMRMAPEICVEVRSPSNSQNDMLRKAEAYLAAGAEEVWIVELDGSRRVIKS